MTDMDRPLTIEEIRAAAEQTRDAMELERYEMERGLRPVGECVEPGGRWPRLFERESLETVESALTAAEAAVESRTGDAAEVARLRRLRSWLTRSFTEREVRSIDEAIHRRAHEARVTDSDGRLHPLRDVRRLLADTEPAEERARLDKARVQACEELAPLLAERLGICHGIARSLGRESFRELWRDCVGIDPEALLELAEGALAETDDMYRDVLGWTVRKRLGCSLEDAGRHDIPHVLAGRYSDYGESYDGKGLLALTREFVGAMGLDLRCHGRLKIELHESRAGAHRAAVHPLHVPRDVRLSLDLPTERRDLLGWLGVLGRGLFLANIDKDCPFEDRRLGDGAIDLSWSRVFENLLLDKTFLKSVLKVQRPRDYDILAWLERLYDLRLVAARVIYELELYSGGSVERMQERYSEIFRRALVVRTPAEMYLHEVRKPFHSIDQLRARTFTALLSEHLGHYFNADWWQNPRTGVFLRQEWAPGRRQDLDEKRRELGGGAPTLRPLLKQFERHL